MTLSVILPQVAAMPGSCYGRAADGPEVIRPGADLGNILTYVFPIGREFTMFSCASYDFYMMENEAAYLNSLQSYCAVVQAYDVELVEGFLKEGIATNGGEEV